METQFLERLLDAAGPSGFEVRPARVWRQEAEGFADRVSVDVSGNSVAEINPDGAPRVMLAGHVDEIGLQITHIDEKGFVFVDEIGGWDAQVVVGQRVTILGKEREVVGVIGKKPIHLILPEDRSKAAKVKELWVDVGARSREEVVALGLRVGDPMVIATRMVRLAGDRIASRAIDNRIGAYVVLEALRKLARERPLAAVAAVATAQEEIGYSGGGARTSAYTLDPQVAIVVDVTFSTDVPDIEKKELGEHAIGGGPVLSRGSAAHPVVFDRLVEAAEAEGIPYSIQAQPKATRTDADAIFLSRSGVPTGLISIPNRYMHSPNELVALSDVQHAIDLIAAFVRRLEPGVDLTPR
ncbi:MAG: M42 family peptidase [Gemmatimonadetes bacterium]|nr:M42 family peptidase [Gemmatimonadota bacterium]